MTDSRTPTDIRAAANARAVANLETIIARATSALAAARGPKGAIGFHFMRAELAFAYALTDYFDDGDLNRAVEALESDLDVGRCTCRGCMTEQTSHDGDYEGDKAAIIRAADQRLQVAA